MSNEETTVQAAAPHALQDFINCPDWGKGGQFVYDPATGKRTRIEPEAAATEEVPQAPAGAAPQDASPAETTTTVRKERTRA